MDNNYKTAIGMMSGTSMDGIDAALVRIYDNFEFEMLNTHTLDYPQEVRNKLLEIANDKGKTSDVCFMDFVVGKLFAQCANELLEKSNIKAGEVDYIASHGQTVFHSPQPQEIGGISTGSTLQIGNISVIAQLTGIKTTGDFRSKDIAAGGQGAPLVAAIWGVFVWKEFKGADRVTNLLLSLMFILFIAGLAAIIISGGN